MFAHRARATKLAEPPLFVLGHWRSGTTLLHELLILDERHTYPNTYECFAPHHFVWTEWFVPPLLAEAAALDAADGHDGSRLGSSAGRRVRPAAISASRRRISPGPSRNTARSPTSISISLRSRDAERERWKEALKSFVHYVAAMRNRRII